MKKCLFSYYNNKGCEVSVKIFDSGKAIEFHPLAQTNTIKQLVKNKKFNCLVLKNVPK